MTDVAIRTAVEGDSRALAELSVQLGYPTSNAQALERLRSILYSDEHLVLVASQSDGAVIGWVHVFLALRIESDRFAELGGFVVNENHRNRGIGRMLLRAAEEWVVDRGVAKLRVRSRSTRQDAHAFYERLGFRSTKQQHVFDKPMVTGD